MNGNDEAQALAEPPGEDAIGNPSRSPEPNMIYDVIPDTGADIDVVGSRAFDKATNKKRVNNIKLKGSSGACTIDKVCDVEHVDGLDTKEGLMNPNSDLTCLSISERAQKGWKFWAEKDYAKLISPLNKAYNFIIKDGLYRLTDKIDESWQHRQETCDEEDVRREEWKQAHVNKAKNKRGNVNVGVLLMLMMVALASNTPAIAAIPFIKHILNASHDNLGNILDVSNPKKRKPKKDNTHTMYEHHCRCHLPHDPRLCDACIRARLMGMKHTTNDNTHKVGRDLVVVVVDASRGRRCPHRCWSLALNC